MTAKSSNPGASYGSSTIPNLPLPQQYHGANGTSFAAPYVTGIVSILRFQNPLMSNNDLKMRILERSTPFVVTRGGESFSAKILNADYVTQ